MYYLNYLTTYTALISILCRALYYQHILTDPQSLFQVNRALSYQCNLPVLQFLLQFYSYFLSVYDILPQFHFIFMLNNLSTYYHSNSTPFSTRQNFSLISMYYFNLSTCFLGNFSSYQCILHSHSTFLATPPATRLIHQHLLSPGRQASRQVMVCLWPTSHTFLKQIKYNPTFQ